jgi:thiol-disulfide isomerase/thioredoxin
MNPKIKASVLSICLLFGSLNAAHNAKAPETIRAKLTLNENQHSWLIWSVDFDQGHLQKILKERNVKLPPGLSSEARVGMTRDSDHVVMVFDKVDGGKAIRAVVDTKQNNDLTDEKPVQLTVNEKNGTGEATVKIERFLGPDRTNPRWLPYYLDYMVHKGKDGKISEHYAYGTFYCMDGLLDAGLRKYRIRLWDLTMDGRFDAEDFKVGSAIAIDLNEDGKFNENEFFTGGQLIPLAGTYYLFESVAEDGSEVVFHRTDLRPLKIGDSAPNFSLTDSQGKIFHLSDYRGQAVLLDFWASWCGFCLEAFPAINDFIKKSSGKPFIVVGVNLDEAKDLDKARQVIDKYKLSWREVIEGNGASSPLYDTFGSKSEFGASLPLYIAIDKAGLVRAGSGKFEDVKKILEELLK